MVNRRRHVKLLGRMIFVVQQSLPSFVIIVSSGGISVCGMCELPVHSCGSIGQRKLTAYIRYVHVVDNVHQHDLVCRIDSHYIEI